MNSREIVVFDADHPCPYLAERTARLPHRLPVEPLTAAQFDERLAQGDRRSGPLLYRPACPACKACEPIRLDIARFRPRENQRRAKRRGDELLTFAAGAPIVDYERVELFNRHRSLRGLEHGDGPIEPEGYQQFLTETCCDTLELTYRHQGELVAVAIADRGQTAMSAVYCFYEPTFRSVSLGTYSVLKQIELCQQSGRRYLYLGYYIAQSTHMAYKALFRPHERLIDSRWTDFA